MAGVRCLTSIALLWLGCSSGSDTLPADPSAPAPGPAASSVTAVSASATGSSDASPLAALDGAIASAHDPMASGVPGGMGSAGVGTARPVDNAPKADASHLVLKGHAKQGGLLFAKVDMEVASIEFPGHRTRVSDDGELLIAFYRNAPRSEMMKIRFKDGSVLEHAFQIEQRTYETDKIDGLPPNVVRLDAADKKANAAVEARIDPVRMKYSPTNCYKDGFIWPTAGKVTSHYGQPRVLNGTDGGIHWGVDMAVPVGTAVKAPACGTVTFTETSDPLSGGTLVIDHGQGLSSTFIHLSAFKKKVGDVVKQGDVVASSGVTGRATGPHLHWAMNFFEIRVDPELLVPARPAK